MKKILSVLLVTLLLLTACSTKQEVPREDVEVSSEFSEYLDTLLVDFVSPSDFGINFILNKPEDYNFEPELYEIGFTTEEDVKESVSEAKEMIKELKKFSESSLSNQQLLDRDVVIEYLEDLIEMEPYYDYEYGSSMIGYQRNTMSNFTSTLESYQFRTKFDVDAYLNLLETFPDAVQKYLDLELVRQKNGTGFGKEEIVEIIKVNTDTAQQAKNSDYFLIAHFNDAVSKLDFLTSDEKNAAIAKHKTLISENLAGAYQNVVDTLSQVDASTSTGLANKPDGKKYYELLLQQETGLKASIKDIEKVLNEEEAKVRKYMMFLSEKDYENMYSRYQKRSFGNFTSGKELLSAIQNAYTEEFPKIDEPYYELRKVDESIAAASSPAFYYTPAIDYNGSEPQIIYINGDFDNSLYTTYAHEGLPGHMYQFSYFMTLKDMHPIRSLVSHTSNAEGWANYTERLAVKYVSDQAYADFYDMMETFTELFHIKADIGIHYYGWNLPEFRELLDTYFVGIDEETAQSIYTMIVHNPATYPTYYLSTIYIKNLKEKAQQELDEKYSDIEFHEAFLSSGSASFNVIEKEIEKYINSKK